MALTLSRAQARLRVELGKNASIVDRKRESLETKREGVERFLRYFQEFLTSVHDETPWRSPTPRRGEKAFRIRIRSR